MHLSWFTILCKEITFHTLEPSAYERRRTKPGQTRTAKARSARRRKTSQRGQQLVYAITETLSQEEAAAVAAATNWPIGAHICCKPYKYKIQNTKGGPRPRPSPGPGPGEAVAVLQFADLWLPPEM